MTIHQFPFTAIIGQEALKTALLVNAVDPRIGGVLIRGHKGAGKTTAARALGSLLPEISAMSGCPYHCDPDRPDAADDACRDKLQSGRNPAIEKIPTPLVELPLSATEDRIVGTLNIESALKQGHIRFEPGLLAAANRGILYVDEVNLLADHLVDLLLDVAVSGINLVEREGIRFSHPSRFMLIGTMNPEEGELRPQFLDRFGLCVTVETVGDPQQRAEIIRRHIEFEQNAATFHEEFRREEEILSRQIATAQLNYHGIAVTDAIRKKSVEIAIEAGVQGHRTEIVLVRAARALTALLDKTEIGPTELCEAARMVLPHRIIAGPLDKPDDISGRIDDILTRSLGISRERDHALSEDEIAFIDNHGFPGSAAAGSMLFTYLKKKALNEPSPRMIASS